MHKINIFLIGIFSVLSLSITSNHGIISTEISEEMMMPIEYVICDDDGFVELNILEIQSEILFDYNGATTEEAIIIGTSTGAVIKLNNISGTITTELICDLPNLLSDIAVDENGEFYGCNFSTIYTIDQTNCNTGAIPNLGSVPSPNALSFDTQGNLYFGGGSGSQVYRFDSDESSPPYLWHDFGSGTPSGDFVILDDKMYISWGVGGNIELYEVTIDADFNYVSHINLGMIIDGTFGLASELGNLYGVATGQLYRIDLDTFTFTTIIVNDFIYGAWFGAAGLHEAFGYEASSHGNLADATSGVNPLPDTLTNTQQGTQTIFVRIENTLTGTFDIIEVTIIIYDNLPDLVMPTNLLICGDETNTVFDLTDVETELLQNVTHAVTVSYHTSEEDATNSVSPLNPNYTATSNQETIYVRVQNNDNECFSITQFDIVINSSPEVAQFVNSPSARLLTDCYIDSNTIGYFDLNDIYPEIVLDGNTSYSLAFYLSEDNAELDINAINPIFFANDGVQEIFVTVTNAVGCKSISNFYVDSACYDTIVDIANIYFPQFFTPNNDLVNDTWNVRGVSKIVRQTSIMYIFDRYGKLVYYFRPEQVEGWDGTYRGKQLPSNDYWYKMELAGGFTFKGNFSLVR